MRKFTKFSMVDTTFYKFAVVHHYESEEKEEIKIATDQPTMMSIGRKSFPISGGPVVAYFVEEKLADEYCEFKNKQLEK